MSSAPDVGAPDPALLAALESGDEARIRAALHGARLLVAVVALPGAERAGEGEHAGEGEMALALLESADGTQALPAFSGLTALAAWRTDARPVPRPARDVIGYACAESLAAVVLDPGAAHSWTLWYEEFAAARPPDAPDAVDPPDEPYAPPTWRASRKARRAAAPYEVYALDTGGGGPAVGVICPEGTLDADWAQRLLARCPEGTVVLALVPAAQPTVAQVGVRL